MLLSHIKNSHIDEAAKIISKQNVPQSYTRSTYKVIVNNQEFPFKYLVRVAHTLTEGNEYDWLNFTSKEIYRDYVKNLGYKINSYNKEIPFFTKDDIIQIINVSKMPYEPNNLDHINIYKRLKATSWKKTEYWYNLLLAELDEYEGEIKKVWAQRGNDNGKKVSAFKSYTWAKIFKEGDQSKNIYFTVGIDGDTQSIIYKLDYKHIRSNFTRQQQDLCYKLIKSPPITIKIPMDNLHLYTWDSLIEETVEFINTHSEKYDKIVEEVWNVNQKRIARLAFNTNGWILPSGIYGKSTHPDSHEARHGYGHEEWLFDTGKLIDGYHYGFLEPIRKQQSAYVEKKYDVWLYTIDGISGRRYWIGEILNVEVLNSEHALKTMSIYKNKGWHHEMENQIKNSGGKDKGFSNWKGVDLFNVRFKPEDLYLNDGYIELPYGHSIYKLSRYSFAHFKDEFIIENESNNGEFNFEPAISNDINNGIPKSSIHVREPRTIEITYLHKAISQKLVAKLKTTYGDSNVRAEYPVGYESNRIDIVVNTPSGIIFYEIKTYPTLKNSIREAIGQLLEYCLWINHNRAKELIIITQPHNNTETAKTYLNHLRSLFNIPVYYQSFDLETGLLSEKV